MTGLVYIKILPLVSLLDSREIKPVSPKRNQPWIFTGRTGAEAETPILWPPDAKSRFTGKDLDAGKDWMARGEWGDGGWDDWMASLTRRTWVWAKSGRQWSTGKPGLLQFMALQRISHDLTTKQQQGVTFLKTVLPVYRQLPWQAAPCSTCRPFHSRIPNLLLKPASPYLSSESPHFCSWLWHRAQLFLCFSRILYFPL